jgi:hypothetical protein
VEKYESEVLLIGKSVGRRRCDDASVEVVLEAAVE